MLVEQQRYKVVHTFSSDIPGFVRFLSLPKLLESLWSNRNLIRELVLADLASRYAGSALGLVWAVLNPLMLLGVYTFVFGEILRARWPGVASEATPVFALTLFCGLVVFSVFSECLSRATTAVIAVPNYVKKIVFPLEVLPVSVVGAAMLHGVLAMAILVVASAAVTGTKPTLLFLPVVLLPLVVLCLAVAWFVASVGVFMRDITHAMNFMVQILFFLTPIFYPVDAVPEPWRGALRLNPLAHIVENMRRIVIVGTPPDVVELGLWVVVMVGVALLAFAWFMRSKPGFADAL